MVSTAESTEHSHSLNEANTQKAVRVLLIVSQSNPLWSQSWSSTEAILPSAIDILRQNQLIKQESIETRLLIKQKWPLRVLIVFDICNNTYDADLGHLPEKNNLPVFVVHFYGKGRSAWRADLGMRQRVNEDTCEAHNLNGKDGSPPYVLDRTTTAPIYLNPRDPSLLIMDVRRG